MTDRAQGLIVTFEDDYRLGDGDSGADAIIQAIKCLRGVANVEPVVANYEDHIARMRARNEISQRLWEALKES